MRNLSKDLLAVVAAVSLAMAGGSLVQAAVPGDEFWSPDYFPAGIDGRIHTALPDVGGIYIAGDFSAVRATAVQNVARLDLVDGMVVGVHPLGSGLEGSVMATCRFQGDLVSVGTFTRSGDTVLNHVGRWDGQAWQPLGDGSPGPFTDKAVVVYRGDLYAGRYRWDGTGWVNFFRTNGAVRTLVVSAGLLYVAGDFTYAKGGDFDHVLGWDGTSVLDLAGGLPGQVVAASAGRDGVAFGWNQSYPFYGHVDRWDGTAWITEQDIGETITSVTYLGDDLYVGNRVVRNFGWGPLSETLKTNGGGNWASVTNGYATPLVTYDGRVLLGTHSEAIDGVISPGLVELGAAGVRAVFPVTGYGRGFQAIAALGTSLVALGDFGAINGQQFPGTGVFSGGVWEPWTALPPETPVNVREIAVVRDTVYCLANFSHGDYSTSECLRYDPLATPARWVRDIGARLQITGEPVDLQAAGGQVYGLSDRGAIMPLKIRIGQDPPICNWCCVRHLDF